MNAANYLGYSDWRLPTMDDISPFSNIQFSYIWSGTEYAPDTASSWAFYTNRRRPLPYTDTDSYRVYAWTAVRPGGNSAAVTSPVPEPETYAMLLAGLGLLSFTARRRKQSA